MKKIIISALFIIFIIFSCAEDPQKSLFNPDLIRKGPAPVINSVSPAESTWAGVGEITISGQNFNPTAPYNNYNQVIFGKTNRTTLALILTMTSTEIVVKSPLITGDEVPVSVASYGADDFSEDFYYKMKPAVQSFGDIRENDVIGGIAVDSEENLYVSINGEFENTIKKITKDGETSIITQTTFLSSPGMVYGPADLIYAVVASGRINKIITIDANTGTQTDFVNMGLTIPKDIDFDADQNLWVIARQQARFEYPCNVVRVTSGGIAEIKTTYDAFLQTVRVHETPGGTPYLYVAGYKDDTEQKIWRNEILSDGNLGPAEVVVDILADPVFNGAVVKALTFSEDNIMYLATDGRPDALFSFDMQSAESAVVYPELIEATLVEMVWGTGPYLYVSRLINSSQSELLKIDLDKFGATYYGRD